MATPKKHKNRGLVTVHAEVIEDVRNPIRGSAGNFDTGKWLGVDRANTATIHVGGDGGRRRLQQHEHAKMGKCRNCSDRRHKTSPSRASRRNTFTLRQ